MKGVWLIVATTTWFFASLALSGSAAAQTRTDRVYASSVSAGGDWDNPARAIGDPGCDSPCECSGVLNGGDSARNDVGTSMTRLHADDFEQLPVDLTSGARCITGVRVNVNGRYGSGDGSGSYFVIVRIDDGSPGGIEIPLDPQNQFADNSTCSWRVPQGYREIGLEHGIDWNANPEWLDRISLHVRRSTDGAGNVQNTSNLLVKGFRISVDSEDPPSCSVNVADIDFGPVGVGGSESRSVSVSNSGGCTLSVDLGLAPGCIGSAAYSLSGEVGPAALVGGESRTVAVHFSPVTTGAFECQIETGCGDVILVRGEGVPVGACAVDDGCYETSQFDCGLNGGSWGGDWSTCGECDVSISVEFATGGAGQSTLGAFVIENNTPFAIEDRIQVDPYSEFSIQQDETTYVDELPYSLSPGSSLNVVVRYSPTAGGSDEGRFLVGGCNYPSAGGPREAVFSAGANSVHPCVDEFGCRMDVSCTSGPDYLGIDSCDEVPELHLSSAILPYGKVLTGQHSDYGLVVRNNNDVIDQVTVLSDCASFEVLGASSFELAPGETREVTIRYSAGVDPGFAAGQVVVQSAVGFYSPRAMAFGQAVSNLLPQNDELSESSATAWGAYAEEYQGDQASAQITDAEDRTFAGNRSLRFQTTGVLDCSMWYPVVRDAGWDFSNVERVSFQVLAENPNPNGFQNSSPWILLGSDDGYFRYQTDGEYLNGAIGGWLAVDMPVAGDTTWHRTIVGEPDLALIDYIEIHMDTWNFAGYTIWIDDIRIGDGPDVPSAVEQYETPATTLTLGPGAPNPFGSLSRFELSVPGKGLAVVEVYDVAGRRVRRLLAEDVSAGSRFVEWNGRDDGGRRVASGVYLIRLATKAGIVQRKVIYLGS